MDKKLVIAVDFDQTVLAGNFPYVFNDIGAIPVLKRLIGEGHLLVLNTLRCDRIDKLPNDLGIEPINGKFLTEAVNFFIRNEIPLFGINAHPHQKQLTDSPKVWADHFIDDRAVGTPLIYDKIRSNEPFVDWATMEIILEDRGILTKTI